MKALVLGSGGARIAYHVGAVQRLLRDGARFDLYAGSSAGAIVAAVLAQYPDGEELAAAEALDFICDLQTKDIWRPWCPFGRLSGLWKYGMVDASPLHRLIREKLSAPLLLCSGKQLRVGAVNLHTGYANAFTERFRFISLAVAASAAMPGLFCPVEIEGGLWCDGAVRDVAPINIAIQAGATDITVVCLTPEIPTYKSPVANAFSALARATDIALTETLEGDLLGARLHTKLAAVGLSKKRPVRITVIRPDAELLASGQDSTTFDPNHALQMKRRGYQDAAVR